jgi:hypothetical protein
VYWGPISGMTSSTLYLYRVFFPLPHVTDRISAGAAKKEDKKLVLSIFPVLKKSNKNPALLFTKNIACVVLKF